MLTDTATGAGIEMIIGEVPDIIAAHPRLITVAEAAEDIVVPAVILHVVIKFGDNAFGCLTGLKYPTVLPTFNNIYQCIIFLL